MRKAVLILALSCLAANLYLVGQQESPAIDPKLFDQLKYRHIGPVGNRVSAVAGVPGDRNVYYAGAASGGIFKSSDAGAHWTPVFDKQPVSSIGSRSGTSST